MHHSQAGKVQGPAEEIAELLACSEKTEEIIGVLDGLRADFALAPLTGEPSCREDLHPFNPAAPQRGRHLPLPAAGLPDHPFRQSSQVRPGDRYRASGRAGASAAGLACAGGYRHLHGAWPLRAW